jgi:hypothetical protein
MLPGAVPPAEVAYGALREALGDGVEAVAKELELYAGEKPPPGYTLDTEIEGILRAVPTRSRSRSSSCLPRAGLLAP